MLRGQTIPKGDRLMLFFASANRDEDHFEAPDDFRIDRTESHIGFGFGAHMGSDGSFALCDGSSVAKK